MTKIALFTLCLTLAASLPALAQTAPPTEPPSHTAPIVGGKNMQPHSVPGQAGPSPEAQIHLLQKGATEEPANEPVVVPRDLYGNPLGGNPGLNPPGLEPTPKS
jgi:hypothetical protein